MDNNNSFKPFLAISLMKIAVPIIAEFQKDVLNEINEATKSKPDIIELRIDYLKTEPNIKALIQECKKYNLQTIITNRAKDEGGYFKGNEFQRIKILQESVNHSPDYVDVELMHFRSAFYKGKSRLIVSYHNFDETPNNLDNFYKKAYDCGADIAKIVTKANSNEDVRRMAELIEKADKPIIGICMGDLGISTRLHPKNYLTFACLPGRPSASGQMTVDYIKEYLSSLNQSEQ